MAEQRKYDAATTILFPLIDFGATDFESTPVVHAAGDTKISKDEGAFANTANAFVHEGNGIYSLALSAAETQAARIVVTIIDQTSPKAWEDQAVLIDTYGNASAQHAFDRDTATVVLTNLSAANAAKLEDMLDGTGATLTAAITGNITGNLSGSVGSVTGAVGSVTGNVGGNVTGSVGSVVGAVGSVTGAVGSVTGNVGGNVVGSVASVTGNVGGNVTGSVGSVVGAVGSVTGAVGSVTGNVGGNVAGSVGSVTGAAGSVTGNLGGNVVGNVNGSVASVVGAVGSVTGAVGSVTGNVGGNVAGSVASIGAGGIVAATFGAGAIDNAAIAAGAITETELVIDDTEAADAADATSSFWERLKWFCRSGIGTNKVDFDATKIQVYNDAAGAALIKHSTAEAAGTQTKDEATDA